jgi:purine-binding chemotaxis protein CheW
MNTAIENKYVIFTLDDEEYGFDVSRVIEIVRLEKLIPIPHSKEYFMGMVDIRGKVIPVIDLKKKLYIYQENSQNPEKLIIVELFNKRIALAVDKVLNVIDFHTEEIDAGPPAVKSFHTKYISGIGKKENRFVVLINLNTLFAEQEIKELFNH